MSSATGADDKPGLENATNTDDINRLGYELAAWGLRHGECDEGSALEWVLSHPHEAKLPRGSQGRANPTKHHIGNGVRDAVDGFNPDLVLVGKPRFDPEPLRRLAARISGSGVTHERYLLGVIALCHRHTTLTPVVTGPSLADAVGVSKQKATDVLRKWNQTLAYGFFTGVSYDGEPGHGRVWAVDPGWQPISKPKHLPGCNRSRSRCQCPGVSQTGLPIFVATKDRSPIMRQTGRDTGAEFNRWVSGLEPRTPLTVTLVAGELGVTRYAATKLLRGAQGGLLDEATAKGRRRGETWFVAESAGKRSQAAARIAATKAKYAQDLAEVTVCDIPGCDRDAPVGQLRCDNHQAGPNPVEEADPFAGPSFDADEPRGYETAPDLDLPPPDVQASILSPW